MKKSFITGIIIVITLSLTACGGSDRREIVSTISTHSYLESTAAKTEPQTESLSEAVENVPIVAYNDILSGNYSDKDVIIECVIDEVKFFKPANYLYFTSWYPYGNTYKTESSESAISLDNSFKGKEEIKNATNGDMFQFHVHIHHDNSIGYFDVKGVKKITPTATLDNIKSSYKNNCSTIKVEDLLRSPDTYKNQDFVFSGTVFQILEQDDDKTSFLLDTGGDNGLIYVLYNRKPNENRILEKDNVTIHGTYYKLDTYTSLLGKQQTVPRIRAMFLTYQ